MKGFYMITAIRSLLFSCLFLSLFTPHHTRPNPGFGTSLALAGAALIGIGGIAAAANWFFTPSDEEVYRTSQDMIHAAQNSYCSLSEYIECAYNIRDEEDCGKIFSYLKEPVLYDIAIALWNSRDLAYVGIDSFRSYSNTLSATLSDLKKQARTVRERIDKLEEQYAAHYAAGDTNYRILKKLRKVHRELKHLIPHIELLYQYLSHHRSYFNLCAVEWALFTKYERELRIINACRYQDPYCLERELVNAMGQLSSGTYPYVNYVYALERHIEDLQYCRSSLTYAYKDRIFYVNTFLDNLNLIRSVVDARYQEECCRKRKDERKQERLRIERERVRIEREKAYELQRYNNIRQQELMMHEENFCGAYGCKPCCTPYYTLEPGINLSFF
jgi:hypothetical protein